MMLGRRDRLGFCQPELHKDVSYMNAKLNIKEFTKLYQNYYVALYGMTLAIVSKKAIARDICKETFKEAIFKIDPIDKPDNKVYQLFSSAREKGLEVINSRARKVEWTDVLEGETESDKRKDIDDMLLLIGGISSFDSKQRQITVLKAKGFSDQLISRIMDLPKQSITWLASQCKLEIKNAGKDYKTFEADVVEVLDKNSPNDLEEMRKECSDLFRKGKNAINGGKIVKSILLVILSLIVVAALGFAVYYLVNNSLRLSIKNNTVSTTSARTTTQPVGQVDYTDYGFDSVAVNCELPTAEKLSIYKPIGDDETAGRVIDYFNNTLAISVEPSAGENQGFSSFISDGEGYSFTINDKYGFFEYKYLKYAPQAGEKDADVKQSCLEDAENIIDGLREVYGAESFPELVLVEDSAAEGDETVHYAFTFVPAEDITIDGIKVEEQITFDYSANGYLVSLSSNIYSGQFEVFGSVPLDDPATPLLTNISQKDGALALNSVTPVYCFDGEYLLIPSAECSYSLNGVDYSETVSFRVNAE